MKNFLSSPAVCFTCERETEEYTLTRISQNHPQLTFTSYSGLLEMPYLIQAGTRVPLPSSVKYKTVTDLSPPSHPPRKSGTAALPQSEA